MGRNHRAKDVQNRQAVKEKALLGAHVGAARGRLGKIIQFDMLQRFNLDTCYRCGKKIEHIEELSVEHKQSWRSAADPKASFFDLDNIAWSHLKCNIGASQREKTHCKRGHSFNEANTIISADGHRACRQCARDYYQKNKELIVRRKKDYYQKNKELMVQYGKDYYQKNKERINRRQKDYRQNNKELIARLRNNYRQNNKELIVRRKKDYYQKNKERINRRQKDDYQKNKERINQRKKDDYQKNKERITQQNRDRYHRNKGM